MKKQADLIHQFHTIFQTGQTPRIFFAPGRINLIGEHTDYNGGHVFPAALSYGTYSLATMRDDQKIRLYSMNFPNVGIIEVDLSNLLFRPSDQWANYPKGVVLYLKERYLGISRGADILYYGNIPNGAGLSSSASIELVTSVLLNELYDLQIDRLSLIQLCQRMENEYIGVNSGIMDQFTVGMGKKEHALLLNCQTLSYQYAPLVLAEHEIVIIHTNKQRTLAGSKYNERRAQSEQALIDLQQELSIRSLCDLTPEQFEEHKDLIKDETSLRRARHAIYENSRTLAAYEKLTGGDLIGFGKLMNESHLSLRDDYEVTGVELDTVVEAAWKQEGVIGARMTGAGFGGCAIAIVRNDHSSNVKENILASYRERVGYDPFFYSAIIGDGAREVTKEAY